MLGNAAGEMESKERRKRIEAIPKRYWKTKTKPPRTAWKIPTRFILIRKFELDCNSEHFNIFKIQLEEPLFSFANTKAHTFKIFWLESFGSTFCIWSNLPKIAGFVRQPNFVPPQKTPKRLAGPLNRKFYHLLLWLPASAVCNSGSIKISSRAFSENLTL